MPRQKNITKYITGYAGGMIAFMVILVPLGHFYFSYQDTLARLETEVEINARLVTRIISANPEMWEFQHLRIEEYLMSRPGKGGAEIRRVLNNKNEIIAESLDELKPPFVRHSSKLMDSGVVVGRLEIYRSLRPLLMQTGLITLLMLPLGFGVFFIFRHLPIRAIHQSEEALRSSEREANRLAEENVIVAEIGRIISSTLSIDEVYKLFSDEVKKLIPFDWISISLINQKEQKFCNRYVDGSPIPGRNPGEAFPIAGTFSEKVLQSRKGIVIEGKRENEILAEFPTLLPIINVGAKSLLSVPLISGNQPIGVLHFRSKKNNIYSERNLRVAESIANQIAGAIANTQIFREYIRAEVSLRDSQDYLKNLLDSIRAGIIVIDLETHAIVDINAFAIEMIGVAKEQVLGRMCHQYICPAEDGKCPITDLGQAVDCSEHVLLKVNGDRIPVLKSVIPTMREGRGYLIESFIDISERKRAEAEAISFQEQLRQSQKMEAIGKLAGGIAHDFNNLLTVIKGYNQLSLMELKKDDPLRANIEEVQKAAERAAALTRHILAFSRRQILQFKVFDLNTLLHNLDKLLRRLIGEDIELVTFYSEDLGKVKTDPGQIEQVVMNLAVNARDAMPHGGKLTIEMANVELDQAYAQVHRGVTPGRYVMFAVSDTGVGMTPEVKERIFEPFFTTKEMGKGTGLGLSTVYGIVKQSGGNIWAYSEPGQGTTFKIYLPRVDESAEEVREKVVREEIPDGNETILVVEDEEPVRNLAVRILQKQGYRVLDASQGDNALLIYKQHKGPIHLMVTDMVMPGMSGLELAQRLESFNSEIKVLFISGYTDQAIVHHGVLERGMNYIQKPFTPDALTRKVREVLNK
jgi:PAS domain S-box-containing protein